MFGYSTLRETWETQWGPQPVLALNEAGSGNRPAPITLPCGGDPFGNANAAYRRPNRPGPRRG